MFPRPAVPIFCSVSRVSEVTLGTKLWLLVLGRPAAPIFCSVSRVSEVTLGTFLVGFSD